MLKDYLDAHEAGQVLKVKARTIRDMTRDGRLPFIDAGTRKMRRILIHRETLRLWLERRKQDVKELKKLERPPRTK